MIHATRARESEARFGGGGGEKLKELPNLIWHNFAQIDGFDREFAFRDPVYSSSYCRKAARSQRIAHFIQIPQVGRCGLQAGYAVIIFRTMLLDKFACA